MNAQFVKSETSINTNEQEESTFNHLLNDCEVLNFDSPNSTLSRDDKWSCVMDACDYPVHMVNAFYKKDGEFLNANGETNTGRDKHFNLVVVDRLRNGDEKVISAVTGKYGTVATVDVYADLRRQLEGIDEDYKLNSLYVAGDGGRQRLTFEFPKMNGVNNIPDELSLRIDLNTSVDGTKAHSLTMNGYYKEGGIQFRVDSKDHKLAARHTSTIKERTINFVPHIVTMIAEWNTVIMPMMELMYDKKYDQDAAFLMIEELAKKSGIGEGHAEGIRKLYESGEIRTNDKSHSLYRINATMNQYIDDVLEGKTELQERFKDKLSKEITKRV